MAMIENKELQRSQGDLTKVRQQQGQLGYGCSLLMARLGRKQSRRLIDHAFAMGITHFDTARLYGYGEAEGVLGDFLQQNRSRVTVTTKIGILPPRRSLWMPASKTVARRLVAAAPFLRNHLRRKAMGLVSEGHFDVETITRSFETSLRELKTDYVDYLLLHECKPSDLKRPELLLFLQRLRQQGKIRGFGIATDIESTETALRSFREYTSVLQIPNSLENGNIQRISGFQAKIITHSILGQCLERLSEQQTSGPPLPTSHVGQVGPEQRKTAIARLLLRNALLENNVGVVLVSSTSETNITQNCLIASASPEPLTRSEASYLNSLSFIREGRSHVTSWS